jgi:hypothetical protein
MATPSGDAMYRVSNGGCGHDLVVKFLTAAKDAVAPETLGLLVVTAVAAAWPDTEPVAAAAVLGRPADHEERVVYVAVHAQTFFRSRVAHSITDPHNMIVTRERVTEPPPYSADEALSRLNACPPCVLAVGVSAVSPSYMAELWGLLQDDAVFTPTATQELVATKDGVERRAPTDHGWDGLV